MSIISFLVPTNVSGFIEKSIPLKGTLTSISCFMLFYTLPDELISAYRGVIVSVSPIYCLFEVMVVSNLLCMLTQKVTRCIDYERSLMGQGPPVVLVAASLAFLAGYAYNLYWLLDLTIVSPPCSNISFWLYTLLLIWCVISSVLPNLIVMVTSSEHSVIVNSLGMSLWIALTDKIALQ